MKTNKHILICMLVQDSLSLLKKQISIFLFACSVLDTELDGSYVSGVTNCISIFSLSQHMIDKRRVKWEIWREKKHVYMDFYKRCISGAQQDLDLPKTGNNKKIVLKHVRSVHDNIHLPT
jgi:hypothetical protein